MQQPVFQHGSHSRLLAAINRHAATSPTFRRETISGLSHGQSATLRQILDLLDTITPTSGHGPMTHIRIVGFGGTGKHQLLRILDEFFNDRSFNSSLRIQILHEAHDHPRSDVDVVIKTSLPFADSNARGGVSEYVISHAGFSTEELEQRLTNFRVPLPESAVLRQICSCVSNYGFGSFALALGIVMSNAGIQSPFQLVLREGIALGEFEDRLASEFLSFHPTVKNLRPVGVVRGVETALSPYIPYGASRAALPTLRRVVTELLEAEKTSDMHSLSVPTNTYASFNQLVAQLIDHQYPRSEIGRNVIKISAELPIDLTERVKAVENDSALSEDSKFVAVLGILITAQNYDLSSGIVSAPPKSIRAELPPIRLRPLLEKYGPPRVTLLLGTLFETLRARRPIVNHVS